MLIFRKPRFWKPSKWAITKDYFRVLVEVQAKNRAVYAFFAFLPLRWLNQRPKTINKKPKSKKTGAAYHCKTVEMTGCHKNGAQSKDTINPQGSI